jgi:hypothetical protein
MPVSITCPKCGAQVELRQHGFVKKHGGTTPCTFVRTAHTGTDFRTSEVRLERAAKRSEAAEAELVRKRAASALRAQAEIDTKERRRREQLAYRLAHPPVQCAKCDGRGQLVEGTSKLHAHLRSDSIRWCSGGVPPTDEQRKKAAKGKKKRSVWATSGGLPTLGQRR